MNPLYDVFFWATIATATMFLETVVFISRRRYRRIVYALAGISAIILFEVPRFIIPLLPQPSIGLDPKLALYIGGGIFALGISIMLISFYQLKTAVQDGKRSLQTSGIYGVVRHPMYMGDVIWPLGWSLALNALYALALTPLWLILRLSFSILEEEKLIEKYGDAYREYIRRVKKRIIPGVI